MENKVIKYGLMAFVSFVVRQGHAADRLNCSLKVGDNDQSVIKLVLEPNGFGYRAQLNSVIAEVEFYGEAGNNNEYIESMKLTDAQTGVSSTFYHNAECSHNQCPVEKNDIKTGWHQLDLGSRGIYQIWCTLH
ncbi:MAG: hypothetical protein ACXVCY_11815 [Pseudobdellovibrionaceae bacterium]